MTYKDSNKDIVMITADALRYSSFNEVTMPFIYRKKGIEFKNCFSPSTWTLPSYASFFTKRTPIQHNITRMEDRIKRGDLTLLDHLRYNNFEVLGFSDNPFLGSMNGFNTGFDFLDENISYKVFPTQYSIIDFRAKDRGKIIEKILQDENTHEDVINLLYGTYRFTRNHIDNLRYDHRSDRILDHMSNLIKHHKKKKVMFTNLLDPHPPYTSSETGSKKLGLEFTTEEKEVLSKGGVKDFLLLKKDPPTTFMGKRLFDDWDDFFSLQLKAYRSQIRYLDLLLEEWFEKNRTYLEDSMVIFTSDHGQLFGEENFCGHHTSLHPNGIHIPLKIFPPKDWGYSDKKVTDNVSLIGLSHALDRYGKGEINTEDEFKATITDQSKIDGKIVIAVDGPTWDTEELKKSYPKKNVKKLEVRKIGLIEGDGMDVYSSYWWNDEIIHRRFEISQNSRTLEYEKIEEPHRDDYKRWLQKSDVNSEKTKLKKVISDMNI
ncbi:MAG: sulfatase-like hydrolase/transferase [Candidatus Natronoplasma sp.]